VSRSINAVLASKIDASVTIQQQANAISVVVTDCHFVPYGHSVDLKVFDFREAYGVEKASLQRPRYYCNELWPRDRR
jgi:hypothetical protein